MDRCRAPVQHPLLERRLAPPNFTREILLGSEFPDGQVARGRDGGFVEAFAEPGNPDPPLGLAFLQGALQDGSRRLIRGGDVARHYQQFQQKLLLEEDASHSNTPFPSEQVAAFKAGEPVRDNFLVIDIIRHAALQGGDQGTSRPIHTWPQTAGEAGRHHMR